MTESIIAFFIGALLAGLFSYKKGFDDAVRNYIDTETGQLAVNILTEVKKNLDKLKKDKEKES